MALMFFLSISGLINGVSCLLLGLYVFLRDRGSSTYRIYLLFALSVAVWSIGYAFWPLADDRLSALNSFRFLHWGAIFIPVFYYHFILSWTQQIRKRAASVAVGYGLAVVFSLIVPTNLFIQDMVPKFIFKFWAVPGAAYHVFLVFFFYYALAALYFIVREMRRSAGIRKSQCRYVLVASVIGYIGGATNYPLWYNIPIYPVFNFLVTIYVAIIAYAIVRYRLMDIRVAVSSAGIFMVVYALTLGFPFYLYNEGLHLQSLILAIILATGAPAIHSRLQRRAADTLLEKERAAHDILLKASQKLAQEKTVDDICRFLMSLLTKVLEVRGAAVYLLDGYKFVVKARAGEQARFPEEIEVGNPSVSYLKCFGVAIPEEVASLNGKNGKNGSGEAADYFRSTGASLALAIMRQDTILGVILMSSKTGEQSFSDQDLVVLRVVAGQAGIAIENANFRREEDERRKKEDAMARREFLDQIVSVMSHEIRNPNGVVCMQTEFLLGMVQQQRHELPDSFSVNAEKLLNAVLTHSGKINDLIDRVRHYSQEHDLNIVPVSIPATLKDIEFFWKAILKKYPGVELAMEVADGLPLVLGDDILIEEIIINYLSNAAHAVAKNEKGSQKAVLRVFKLNDDFVRIEVQDNGYGIKPDVLKKLFHIPMTTKINSEGTGLGCWQIRKICDTLGAHYGLDSAGPGLGSRAWADLRIVKQDGEGKV